MHCVSFDQDLSVESCPRHDDPGMLGLDAWDWIGVVGVLEILGYHSRRAL
jgi:hypothetical protein